MKAEKPPRVPGWLIDSSAWYEDGYSVYGDFCEEYSEILESKGRARASLWFWKQAIRTFPVFLCDFFLWRMIMLKNYLKVAFRNIKKQKGYATINIAGLAIGMAACILILIWVYDELNFDAYHENTDRIYRLTVDANLGTQLKAPVSPTPAGPAMVADYPEVLQFARITRPNRSPVVAERKEFFEENVAFADNSIFEVFSFPFLQGDPATALETAYTAVLTEDIAVKYFGDDDPLGKMITFGGGDEYTITGVVRNVPANSHFTFDILRSMETQYVENRPMMDNWMAISQFTYLLLAEGTDAGALEQKLPALIEKNMGPILRAVGASVTLYLQPLRDIHLHSDFAMDIGAQGDIKYVYLFSTIALFVLLIACINFINLSTARSAMRAQEVGLRKTLGAVRNKLVGQFLGESIIYSLCSLLLAIGLIFLVLPWFSGLIGRDLTLNIIRMPWLIPAFLGLALVVGITAGSYPAFFLSAFQPVRVLRGKLKFGTKNIQLRRALVILQFAISIVLILGTMTIYKQIIYMKSADLGFEKDHIVVLPGLNDSMEESYQTLRQEFGNLPGVIEVGATSMIPGRGFRKSAFRPEGFSMEESQTMDYLNIDPGFMNALGIQIAAGRNFDENLSTDRTESVIINEMAARKFGWDNPIGKQFIFTEDENTLEGEQRMNVIGLIKDYHNTSLRLPIEPMILFYDPDSCSAFTLRISPSNVSHTVAVIKNKWKELLPHKPFDYYFLDEFFDSQYKAEERMGNLFLRFSLLAVFIGSLGLFGMASYTTEQRTKEIGIRKVLGASAGLIIRMLSREYLILVAIGNLIAWPTAYLLVNSWLSSFAYRISLPLWIFAVAAALSLTVALLTVSYQSARAAFSNPVESLRYE